MRVIGHINVRAVDFLADCIRQDVSPSAVSALFPIFAFDKLRGKISGDLNKNNQR